eukprot:2867833-Rhodomonas_salina.4
MPSRVSPGHSDAVQTEVMHRYTTDAPILVQKYCNVTYRGNALSSVVTGNQKIVSVITVTVTNCQCRLRLSASRRARDPSPESRREPEGIKFNSRGAGGGGADPGPGVTRTESPSATGREGPGGA